MTPLCGVIRFSERASKASGAQPFFILYRWHGCFIFLISKHPKCKTSVLHVIFKNTEVLFTVSLFDTQTRV